MAGKIRKHSGKIFIFIINLFLMTIAVFVIKDKDQAKRSSETQKNLLDENSTLKVELQSLKGVLNKINSALSAEETNISAPATPSPVISSPAAPDPAPVQKKAPSNARTKTS